MKKEDLIKTIFNHFYFGPTYSYECIPEIEFTIKRYGLVYSGKIKSFQQYGSDYTKPALLFEVSGGKIISKSGYTIKLKTLNKQNIPLSVLNIIYRDYIKTHTNKW